MIRYQLGDEVPISIQSRDADGSPALPDATTSRLVAAPLLNIYDSASALVETLRMPPKDRDGAAGLFEHFIRLDSDYATGVYSWRADWLVGGAAQVASGYFNVVAGGDADGAVVSAEFIDKRGSQHLLQHLSTQDYAFGPNPRL